MCMKGVDGYKKMLDMQQEHWPSSSRCPLTWAISRNLCNSMHKDKNDLSASYAIWLRTGNGSQSWFLLFPRNGLAICLSHKVAMTWEGREVAHCTSIPEVDPGDDFLSLFTSVPRNATEQLTKLKAFRQRMHARAERRTAGVPCEPHWDAARTRPTVKKRTHFQKGDKCTLLKAVTGSMPEGMTKQARRRQVWTAEFSGAGGGGREGL